MCGIVGILDFGKKKISKEEIKYFTKSLDHRGPDGSNYFINEKKNLAFGHTRLSIIDISEKANQPFYFDNNRLVLTFNGEIYNFIEIKKELETLGYRFKTSSDTEVLLLAYDKWGEDCQKKFNGMWAFAIWDQKKNQIFISRDRFGVKPIYYLMTNNRFYFASELKSFMNIIKEDIPNFNYDNFKYCSESVVNGSYYSTEETFLKNVNELNAGCQLYINLDGRIKISKWWSTIENLPEVPNNYNDQKDKFFEIFKKACNLRMRSDVKIATTLSGGLDSSSIVATINQIKNSSTFIDKAQNPYKTFILDYQNEKNNETKYANLVAKFHNLDVENVEVDLGKVDYNQIIKIIYSQEEVTGDDGIGPWNIYKSIKNNGIKVSIDGHGGDELLAGYSGYPKIAMKDCSNLNLKRLYQLFKLHLQMNDKSLEEKHFFKIFFDKINFRLKKYFIKSEQDQVNYNFLDVQTSNNQFEIKENLNSLGNLNQSLYIDYHYRAIQMNLKKYDKFAMAHGVECRFPFLDWELATYCFALPEKAKIDNGFTKKILRDSMKNLLPGEVLNRVPKKGFNPANELFNKTLRKFTFETIDSSEFKNLGIWNKHKIDFIKTTNQKLDLKKIFRNLQIFYLIKTFKEKALKKNEF